MSDSVQKSRQVVYTRFFYKQHFYKQRQAEIGQEKLKLSSTLSPWAWTFAIWIFFSLCLSTLSSWGWKWTLDHKIWHK